MTNLVVGVICCYFEATGMLNAFAHQADYAGYVLAGMLALQMVSIGMNLVKDNK